MLFSITCYENETIAYIDRRLTTVSSVFDTFSTIDSVGICCNCHKDMKSAPALRVLSHHNSLFFALGLFRTLGASVHRLKAGRISGECLVIPEQKRERTRAESEQARWDGAIKAVAADDDDESSKMF